MPGVLINIGSNSSHPNGRGRVFEDFTFEYLPIPENKKTKQKVPTYRELGFGHVKSPDLPVHLDPRFETFTYGHVERGFGDIRSLLELKKEDVLFFYATLQKEEGWSIYIIGYFRNLRVYDCRKLSEKEILNLKSKGFADNAHLKRLQPSVDLLIQGGENSKFLRRAFPLAEEDYHLSLREPLNEIIRTATRKRVRSGTPWFRWTLICEDSVQLLDMISHCDIRDRCQRKSTRSCQSGSRL